MKHVINSDTGENITVQTLPGACCIAISAFNRNTARPGEIPQTAFLTTAQVGALIASLQMCGEHVEQWDKPTGVRCHGDLCAGGQVACPSPKACGVVA